MSTDEIEKKLESYVNLLLKWNQSINLISRNTTNDIWQRHIYDCAQLAQYLSSDDHVCDIGSGAGLPGIILSILKIKKITLIESDSRKCAFLNQAKLLSNNEIIILNQRIEEGILTEKIDVVTARALSSINNLLEFSRIIKPKKGFLLLKGENFQKELAEAKKNWHFEVNIKPSETNSSSAIIEILNVQPK